MRKNPRIVVASDSFKGSLTSIEVAEAVGEGILAVYPDAEIIKINVADGGEGTTEAILESTDGEIVTAEASDPLGRKIKTFYGLTGNGRTAIIEVAAASGLTLLSPSERNPMAASTFGTGEIIVDAIDRGCRKFMIGLGGSATNDCGLGMLTALGYKFHDSYGNTLDGCGVSLARVASIDDSNVHPHLHDCEFTVACDVDNPLFGPRGAAYTFAPQKGADMHMVHELDEGLRNFSMRIHEFCGKDVSTIPGSGAAGGLGAAFMGFTDCSMVRGIDMVLDAVHFEEIISGADLVITGEGRIDEQTARGKVPAGILKRAKNQGIKIVAIGGTVACQNLGFDATIQITPTGMALETAMQPEIAKGNIAKAVKAYLSPSPDEN